VDSQLPVVVASEEARIEDALFEGKKVRRRDGVVGAQRERAACLSTFLSLPVYPCGHVVCGGPGFRVCTTALVQTSKAVNGRSQCTFVLIFTPGVYIKNFFLFAYLSAISDTISYQLSVYQLLDY